MSPAGLILAGGMGRRWGGPKANALLPDGRSFLQRCAETLQHAGVAPVVATVPCGCPIDQADQVGATVELLALPTPDLDMFASIRHGLSRLLKEPGWQTVVVLPVDHPLVRPQTVRALVAADAVAAIPTLHGRHGHPVCLGRALADQALVTAPAILNLRDLLKTAAVVDVPVHDPGVRGNCNTPDALHQALQRCQP